MGYDYSNNKVKIPAWRSDVIHRVDIAEDVAIAYGYDNFKPKIPDVATIAEEAPKNKIQSKISEILIGLGLQEISTYHLIKPEELSLSALKDPIELLDSKTDYKLLRPNLLLPTLRILGENKDNDYPQKFFEIGTIFQKSDSQIKEQTNLIITSSPANFTDLKQILDYLAKALNISYTLKEESHKELIEGRSAQIQVNNKPIGYLGEIHPSTLKAWNLKMPASVLEISLEEIFNLLNRNNSDPS